MTVSNIIALSGSMFVLAIIPGPSVFAVVARSIASGFSHGFITTIGIVAGDFIFILLAIYGLWAIAETLEGLFFLVKYLGGAYLIWLGTGLLRSKPTAVEVEGVNEISWWSNFLCGLFITLGDPKAILFYMSFLPAFVDLSSIDSLDTGFIMLSAMFAVGGAKLGYAYMAHKARVLFKKGRSKRVINFSAASVMMGTGIFLIVKA